VAISTEPNNDIVILDLASGEFRSKGIQEGHRLMDVAFSQDWSALIGVDNNTLEFWELDQRAPTWTWDCVGTRTHTAFSTDGSLLVVCLDAQHVEVRNIRQRLLVSELSLDKQNRVSAIAVSCRGIVAVGFKTGNIVLFDGNSGHQIATLLGHIDFIKSLCDFS
jgi:WD40 repeat protein